MFSVRRACGLLSIDGSVNSSAPACICTLPDHRSVPEGGRRNPVFFCGGRWCPRSAAVHLSGNRDACILSTAGVPAEQQCSDAGSGTGSPEPEIPRKENRPFPEEPAARETNISSYAGITQIRSTGHGVYADSQPAAASSHFLHFLQFIYDSFQYRRTCLTCQPLHFGSGCAMMGAVRHMMQHRHATS